MKRALMTTKSKYIAEMDW